MRWIVIARRFSNVVGAQTLMLPRICALWKEVEGRMSMRSVPSDVPSISSSCSLLAICCASKRLSLVSNAGSWLIDVLLCGLPWKPLPKLGEEPEAGDELPSLPLLPPAKKPGCCGGAVCLFLTRLSAAGFKANPPTAPDGNCCC